MRIEISDKELLEELKEKSTKTVRDLLSEVCWFAVRDRTKPHIKEEVERVADEFFAGETDEWKPMVAAELKLQVRRAIADDLAKRVKENPEWFAYLVEQYGIVMAKRTRKTEEGDEE